MGDIYLIAGIAATCFLLLMVLFGMGDSDVDAHGHDVDVAHPGDGHSGAHDVGVSPSQFGINLILAFVAGFGWGGVLALKAFGLDEGKALMVALASGVILHRLIFLLLKFFYSQQSTSTVSLGALASQVGTVTVAIPEGAGIGEVTVGSGGGSLSRMAKSDSGREIEKNVSVKIVRFEGAVAIVERVSSTA